MTSYRKDYRKAKEGETVMDKFEKALQVIESIAEKYGVSSIETSQVREDMGSFRIRVVLIGAFSAGKSALLNTFLDRDLLQEGQRPETALASELFYDGNEHVEAVCGDDVKQLDLMDAVSVDPKEYDYLKWHLNSEILKNLGDYTLVDMPGFNSGIQAHNKAILQYVDKANAYLLVIDIEDGGIKKSVNAFINEIRHYQDNLAIVLTKADLKEEQECAEIKSSVEWMASDLFGKDVEVIVTSKFDDDVEMKLSSLIKKFSQEEIFRQTFVPPIVEVGEQLLNVLGVLKKNSRLETSQLEEEIRKRERAREKLVRKIQNEKANLRNQLQSTVKPAILADAENALRQQADALTQSIESGGANFSMLVNNILRPVLVSSTKHYVENSFEDFVSHFTFNEISMESDACKDIMNRYKDMQERVGNLQENAQKLNGVYKAITTALAVTTTVIAPWLELILIFLPDIIGLFKGLMPNRKHEQIAEKVSRQVIPDIILHMEPEIEKSLQDMEGEMLGKLEEDLNEMIDQETAALSSAKEKLSQEKSNFANRLQELEQDISMVQAAIDEL